MKYDIFISYRRKDSFGKSNVPTARQFKLAFEAPPYNYKVFFDYSECTDNYFSDTILPAIRTCDFFVLVLTRDCLLRCSNEGDWVRREIEEAMSYGRKIVPISPDKECESWPSLPNSLWKLNGLQITTIYTDHMFESGIDFLVKNRFCLDKGGKDVGREKYIKTNCPEGAINSIFSVSPTKKVYFSKGNLQYQASKGVWRFAENQFNMIGKNNERISPYNDDWIDLFGWGTGDDPTKKTIWNNSYNTFTDWGSNEISNGGNRAGLWRTLTGDEWRYLFDERISMSGIRYVKSRVNNVNGVILLPDDWNTTTFYLNDANDGGAMYNSNLISISQWIILQDAGAVFLPAAGLRFRAQPRFLCSDGYYYSTNPRSYVHFWSSAISNCLNSQEHEGNLRYFGQSVRLVRDIE